MSNVGFNYVNIIGYEGWLNLFFDDYCVALVNNKLIADKIRLGVVERTRE